MGAEPMETAAQTRTHSKKHRSNDQCFLFAVNRLDVQLIAAGGVSERNRAKRGDNPATAGRQNKKTST